MKKGVTNLEWSLQMNAYKSGWTLWCWSRTGCKARVFTHTHRYRNKVVSGWAMHMCTLCPLTELGTASPHSQRAHPETTAWLLITILQQRELSSLEKWLIPELHEGNYKMNLHILLSGKQRSIQKMMGTCKKNIKASWIGSSWPNLKNLNMKIKK